MFVFFLDDENSSHVTPPKTRNYGDTVSERGVKPVRKLPPIHPEVHKWFDTVDSKQQGRITAKELQQAFETFQGRHFSDNSCKFVVRLFDLDRNGGLDVKEFEQLYFYVKQWVNSFNTYDRERSGFLTENELQCALIHMDINFSPEFIKFLIQRYDPNSKKISLDQFIMTCIQIQKYTEEFKARDDKYAGEIKIKYEDFLEMIMRCL